VLRPVKKKDVIFVCFVLLGSCATDLGGRDALRDSVRLVDVSVENSRRRLRGESWRVGCMVGGLEELGNYVR
jgi:hypothetical protein